MKLIDAFQAEHELIDQVLGAFRTYADRLGEPDADADVDPQDGRRFAAFFAEYVGHFHVEREEQILFAALVDDAGLPADRGPVHAITQEHREMDAWLRRMQPLLEQGSLAPNDRHALRMLATRYSHALWRHIDAENSVLYQEGAERLGRYGVSELPNRAMRPAEAAAQADAAALLGRYPAREDATLTRGEGCFMCSAHGKTCEGLEAEWWDEMEWDDFFNR